MKEAKWEAIVFRWKYSTVEREWRRIKVRVVGIGRCHLLELGAMASAAAALEMVLATLLGIHRLKVQLSNITNKHLKHIGKGNLIRPMSKLCMLLENENEDRL
jgi:2C-methyl-D-erythritol 2,4-cyclodiphosphate synthase